jgi:hypothetical protein
MSRMNWERVQAEDLGRRRGYEKISTGPFCAPPKKTGNMPKKVKYPQPPKHPKKHKPPKKRAPKTPLRTPFHAGSPPENLRSYDGRRVA